MNQKWQKLLTLAVVSPVSVVVSFSTTIVSASTEMPLSELINKEQHKAVVSSLNASQENETANTVASSEPTTEPETSELPQKMIEEPQLPSVSGISAVLTARFSRFVGSS
jgi:hypothetical protein